MLVLNCQLSKVKSLSCLTAGFSCDQAMKLRAMKCTLAISSFTRIFLSLYFLVLLDIRLMHFVLFGQTPGFWLTLLSNSFPCGALIAASTSVCNTNRIQQRASVLHVWNQVRGKPQKIQALVGSGDAIRYLVQRCALCGPTSLLFSPSFTFSS